MNKLGKAPESTVGNLDKYLSQVIKNTRIIYVKDNLIFLNPNSYPKLQNNKYPGKYLVFGRKGFHVCNHQICTVDCGFLQLFEKQSKQY